MTLKTLSVAWQIIKWKEISDQHGHYLLMMSLVTKAMTDTFVLVSKELHYQSYSGKMKPYLYRLGRISTKWPDDG